MLMAWMGGMVRVILLRKLRRRSDCVKGFHVCSPVLVGDDAMYGLARYEKRNRITFVLLLKAYKVELKPATSVHPAQDDVSKLTSQRAVEIQSGPEIAAM